MSFFNTLHQYVSNSVANLNISSRRFSASSRSESAAADGAVSMPTTPLLSSSRDNKCGEVSDATAPQTGVATRRRDRPIRPSGTPHHLLQERSKSLKSGNSSHPNSPHLGSKRSTRTSSLKEVPSVSIAATGNSTGSGFLLTSTSSSTCGSPSKKKGPKLIPSFAIEGAIRRTSWPQFAITGSGVQESDGSFFESYTALCWKQENRRLQVLREDDISDHLTLKNSTDDIADPATYQELEQLYVEVLYTIRHKLGADSAKYPHHYKEDLVHYAKVAFGVGHEYHQRCNSIATEEKPPIVVLNVMVIEAEGLEAKDPNGFSDPYCMLGIQPGNPISKPDQQQPLQQPQQQSQQQHQLQHQQQVVTNDAGFCSLSRLNSDEGLGGADRRESLINSVQLERVKKYHNFRLSFKKKETPSPLGQMSSGGSSCSTVNCGTNNSICGSGREQRDSLNAALPAKFIRATSVKNATLNPKWNERFRFDIDDACSDTLHLDIWDHDDEYSVLDAVSKLNEVRGVKGLGRFFKQIAQSARSGNQDDFLGCVNISLQEIPSTGVECWYKLGGRSQRSTIQGRIHLKLWLSTREDFGTSEEDNWTELKQQEQLLGVFIDFEISRLKNSTSQWSGELSQAGLSILHQHAIQGDITVMQSHVVRWLAFSRKLPDKLLHFSVLFHILKDLDSHWTSDPISREEEDALAQSFTEFVDYCLLSIRRLRNFFGLKHSNVSCLEYLLKCLMQLDNMRAFRRCCPFHKDIRGEIISYVRKGATEWFNLQLQSCVPARDAGNWSAYVNGLTILTNKIYADLTRSLQVYDDLFQKIVTVPYFVLVYKNHAKMIAHEYNSRLNGIPANFHNGCEVPIENASPVFELNIALQDLHKFQDHVPAEELHNHTLDLNCHECFRIVLEYWLIIARSKAINRIRTAVELDSFTNVEPYLKYSTSAIDTTSCFYQICDFWQQMSWPDLITSYPFVYSIVEMIIASAIVYADLIFLRVQTASFFSEDSKLASMGEEVYVNLNNLQHVKNALSQLPQTLNISAIINAVDGPSMLDIQRSPVSGPSRSASMTSGVAYNSGNYDNSARQAFHGLMDTASDHYENKLLRIAGCLAEKIRGELKKNIFHLAWSPDSLPAEEAASPLLDCLDHLLGQMEPNLLPAAFHRCVAAIWDVLLVELWNQAEISSGDKLCKFYERLFDALQLFVSFLHADSKGLPLEALHSATYQRVLEKISLHKTPTEQLIDIYYMGRLEQQQVHSGSAESSPYGVLSLRVYFHHDSLSVEIISAKDVIPLDPNGLSDPFVIIELLPRRLFPNCKEQRTTVQHQCLNPVFDECYEFAVTVEQCRQESAMLLFTVMDYDVLTANDFAGEALLSLNTIPGVATTPQGLDTFHGLKQIDLVLMFQQNKHHPILSVLESRIPDRQAQDFVRKQRDRIVS